MIDFFPPLSDIFQQWCVYVLNHHKRLENHDKYDGNKAKIQYFHNFLLFNIHIQHLGAVFKLLNWIVALLNYQDYHYKVDQTWHVTFEHCNHETNCDHSYTKTIFNDTVSSDNGILFDA